MLFQLNWIAWTIQLNLVDWIIAPIKLNSLNDSIESLLLVDWIIWIVVSIKLNSLNDTIELLLLVDWIIWIIVSIKLNNLYDSVESLLLVDGIIWIIAPIKLNNSTEFLRLSKSAQLDHNFQSSNNHLSSIVSRNFRILRANFTANFTKVHNDTTDDTHTHTYVFFKQIKRPTIDHPRL